MPGQLNEIGAARESIFQGLKDIAVEKKVYPVFEIAGHTDSRGSDEYNLRLSRQRAQAVTDYLLKNFKIPRDKLLPRGYGKRRLLVPDVGSEAAYALNRRVEIIRRESRPEGSTRSRSVGSGEKEDLKLVIETGFFYRGGKAVPGWSFCRKAAGCVPGWTNTSCTFDPLKSATSMFCRRTGEETQRFSSRERGPMAGWRPTGTIGCRLPAGNFLSMTQKETRNSGWLPLPGLLKPLCLECL